MAHRSPFKFFGPLLKKRNICIFGENLTVGWGRRWQCWIHRVTAVLMVCWWSQTNMGHDWGEQVAARSLVHCVGHLKFLKSIIYNICLFWKSWLKLLCSEMFALPERWANFAEAGIVRKSQSWPSSHAKAAAAIQGCPAQLQPAYALALPKNCGANTCAGPPKKMRSLDNTTTTH